MLDSSTIKGFVGSLLAHKFDAASKIPQAHEDWWELCCSEDRHVAIAAPRGHAKSTSVTLSFALASLLFRQSRFLLIVSNTESQAKMFLGDLKTELTENEDLISLFGVKKFVKLTETDIIVEMEDKHRFRVMIRGAEQSMRGVKWDHSRPDLIVCDDLEGDEQVLNKDRREKFRMWFYNALMPAKSSNGKIVVVGTILHLDSLLERLMPKEHEKTTIIEDLKVYSTKKSMWRAVKFRANNEDFSKILWPERFPKEKLMAIRQDYIDQGMPEGYAREYLNYPIDESSSYFKRDDFLPLLPVDIEDIDTKRVRYYSGVDFAVSKAERSDWTVILTVAVNSMGDILVIDVRRGRWDSAEIVEQMFSVQKRYSPELITVETGAIQKAIGPFLAREMQTRNLYMNINPMTPTKDKVSRARSIQARLRSGGIRFDKQRFWYDTLEDEMARFPRDRHDDQVDALSWIGLTLDKITEGPTKKEIDDEEYESEMSHSYDMQSGRNAVTGY